MTPQHLPTANFKIYTLAPFYTLKSNTTRLHKKRQCVNVRLLPQSQCVNFFTHWLLHTRAANSLIFTQINQKNQPELEISDSPSAQPSRRRHDVTKSFLFFLYPTAFSDRCQSIGAILIFIGTFCT
jgi:hypothetical protein